MKAFMHTIEEKITLPSYFKENVEQLLFFDIETTGFSADITALYLIGFIYFKDNNWILEQCFCENQADERELILHFLELSTAKNKLICYNGSLFDLPYLSKKAEAHGISLPLSSFSVIDFYKEFRVYKNLFRLENTKQPTFESFIGIKRTGDKSGKELISYYSDYLSKKGGKDAETLLQEMINHNKNDLLGLFLLSKLYIFTSFLQNPSFSSDFKLYFYQNTESTSLEEIINLSEEQYKTQSFSLIVEFFLPFVPTFIYEESGLKIDGRNNILSISLPLYYLELKYFYEDYKNYYYLPKEDQAVHKSIASFMEKDYRIKAKANTCYTKHKEIFLPCYTKQVPASFSIFKQTHEDKRFFCRLKEFLDSEKKESYFASLLSSLSKKNSPS